MSGDRLRGRRRAPGRSADRVTTPLPDQRRTLRRVGVRVYRRRPTEAAVPPCDSLGLLSPVRAAISLSAAGVRRRVVALRSVERLPEVERRALVVDALGEQPV